MGYNFFFSRFYGSLLEFTKYLWVTTQFYNFMGHNSFFDDFQYIFLFLFNFRPSPTAGPVSGIQITRYSVFRIAIVYRLMEIKSRFFTSLIFMRVEVAGSLEKRVLKGLEEENVCCRDFYVLLTFYFLLLYLLLCFHRYLLYILCILL